MIDGGVVSGKFGKGLKVNNCGILVLLSSDVKFFEVFVDGMFFVI